MAIRLIRFLILSVSFLSFIACSKSHIVKVETTRKVLEKFQEKSLYYVKVSERYGNSEKVVLTKEEWDLVVVGEYYQFSIEKDEIVGLVQEK